jgi:hypothetical protein
VAMCIRVHPRYFGDREARASIALLGGNMMRRDWLWRPVVRLNIVTGPRDVVRGL